jgi:hypothetical protein
VCTAVSLARFTRDFLFICVNMTQIGCCIGVEFRQVVGENVGEQRRAVELLFQPTLLDKC